MFGYSSLAFTLARNVVLVPLYLHFMDLAEYGAWLATGGALAQLLVTDFGLSGVVTQRVAAQAGGGNFDRLRVLVGAGLLNAAILGLVLTAASSLLAAYLPATQGLSAAQVTRVFDCFLIAVAANGLGVVSAAGLAAVRGLQRPVAAGAAALVADVVSIVVTVVCLFAGLGLYGLALGLLARTAIAAVSGVGILAVLFRKDLRRLLTPQWSESLQMWRDSGRFFVTSIAMRLQSQANILLVGTILGPQSAAIYGLTVRAHETVHIIMGQLNSSFGPVLAHLAGAGQHARLDAVIRTLLPVVAAVAAVGAVCVVVLNESFMGLWVGSVAYGGWTLTALMGVALWITSVSYVAYEALLARGEFAFIARVFAAASVLHVLTLIVVLRWGAWAAPLALCVSSLSWGAVFWRRVAREMTPLAPAWPRYLTEPVLIAAVALATGALLAAVLPRATSWSAFIVEFTMCLVIAGAVLLIVRPPLRKLLREELVTTLRLMRAA